MTRDRMPHQDYRETNFPLHLLYIKTAVKHLNAIDKCMRVLSEFSNGNLIDMISAMEEERAYLIKANPAYADADEIMKSIAPTFQEEDVDFRALMGVEDTEGAEPLPPQT